ncbi:alpha-ketoglutarate-dependent dioxygenase AlkB family protein [Pseudoxanthomonas sacheonensis]|uniref:alpha-ketoglutarate-dependent dioxygenase AlkB family protein n=1 Tax=Pseudoxanthomonas sacheonensis TaxID=443615 RepID=UPI0013D7D8C6|nr:alpha-ketoglutarate-dependent dioxygenase AlkB [Pseudoxanthomonas sacheonensis]KAF1706175.1 alpha-ketoglutarate-dependent dioxygenase AlkB [Pseudoxanthomonas sacheonensis]
MSVLRPLATNGNDQALPGAELWFAPDWLQAGQADALFAELRDAIEWETHRIRLFGREVDSPRLSCWIGDEDAAYTYSGTRFQPRPWPLPLTELRRRLARELDCRFNSVLANRYRHGRDYMGWHSDDESELGPQPVIASLSLGATRRFVLKHRREPSRKLELPLAHGSLLVMRGDTQANYRHSLPRTARPVGERINLTFRLILKQ